MEELIYDKRPTEQEYFLKLCRATADRATCQKLKVGCVLTDSETGIIIATGYNGAPRGKPHCIEKGCILDAYGKCLRCVHAEANALISAPRTKNTILWCTYVPCYACCHLIINGGVKEVVCELDYRDPICARFTTFQHTNYQIDYLIDAGIKVSQFE
jgi:dCMP deaminase